MVSPRATTIRFGTRRLAVPSGRPLLAALLGDRLPILQRSIRYHRPRAPFCGVGQCTNCLLRVNGVPNVRSCEYVPSEGDVVETENAWPSPSLDLLAVFDVLAPHGIDTLRGFRRPAFATPLYHRVIRRLAGYGRLADAGPVTAPPTGRRIDTDVLVVGAGRSGAAAVRTLKERGAVTVSVDRASSAGRSGADIQLAGTTAAFLPPPRGTGPRPWTLLAVTDRTVGVEIRARSVIVATGGYDSGLWFSGSDRPGVLTAEGALSLSGPSGAPPFRRAVVVGGGGRAAEMLDRFGARVEAVVAPSTISPNVTEKASALDIPMFPRTLVAASVGRRRVRGVRLRTRSDGKEFELATDAVVLAHRRLPNPQLFFQAGAGMEWRGAGGAYYPTLPEGTATTRPGLFAAGEGAGFDDDDAAESSGVAAALQALGDAPPASFAGASRVASSGPHEMESYYRQLLVGARPRGKWVVCPCEDVLLSEVEEASARGYRGIEVIKRYTGVGTGLCQGRYCLPDTLLLLARLESRSPSEVGYITQRPPVLPLPLSAFASLPDDVAEGPA